MIGAQLPDEEILGKAYDARLMARILRYLRPYWKLLAVAFVFLLLQTGTQLLGPYITKIAIDRYVLATGCSWPRFDGAGLSRRGLVRLCRAVRADLHHRVYRPARHA